MKIKDTIPKQSPLENYTFINPLGMGIEITFPIHIQFKAEPITNAASLSYENGHFQVISVRYSTEIISLYEKHVYSNSSLVGKLCDLYAMSSRYSLHILSDSTMTILRSVVAHNRKLTRLEARLLNDLCEKTHVVP